jgi:hypothetical protein
MSREQHEELYVPSRHCALAPAGTWSCVAFAGEWTSCPSFAL